MGWYRNWNRFNYIVVYLKGNILKKKVTEICLDIALKNLHKHNEQFKHFSFVIQSNKIIDWSTNRTAEPLKHFGYADYTKIHSETDAYRKAKGIMDHTIPFDVVNIRLSKNGTIRGSCPCKSCFTYLKKLDCREIWFTTDLEVFAEMDVRNANLSLLKDFQADIHPIDKSRGF